MRRYVAILLFVAGSALSSAQTTLFSSFKNTLNEKSLPVVNLSSGTVYKYKYVQGNIEIVYYENGNLVDNTYYCMLRYRGGNSTKYTKRSYAVKLVDENGEDLDVNLLGIREENNWILDAMAVDRIRMRNRVCFDIWNQISYTPYRTDFNNRNGTKGEFVEVFLNGKYHGIYCLSDKIDRKLLGLKKIKTDDDGGQTVRGLLYKGKDWKNKSIYLKDYVSWKYDTVIWNSWELSYPDDFPSKDTWQPMMDLIDFCNSSPDEFTDHINEWFYIDNLVDLVVFVWALNVGDNVFKNTFLSTVDITKGHRYLVSPWDMDMSLYSKWDGTYYDKMAALGRFDTIAPFNKLIEYNIEGFNDKVKERWMELYDDVFLPDNVFSLLDYYAQRFIESGAWKRESSRWYAPVPLKQDLMEELDLVKDWYNRNYNYLCEQLMTGSSVGTPFKRPETPVSVYTIDGIRIDDPDISPDLKPGTYLIDGKIRVVR